ncbi:MAG: hypothetical protein EAZ97_08745 [Bacteroidetes bacterium]|nr:MAG: hypothetical protein EAZ97_08745 [Bacteroidota bacterium]
MSAQTTSGLGCLCGHKQRLSCTIRFLCVFRKNYQKTHVNCQKNKNMQLTIEIHNSSDLELIFRLNDFFCIFLKYFSYFCFLRTKIDTYFAQFKKSK